MNDEIRLLPCAHCGSPAQFAENENEGLHGMEYIECTNTQCGMATLLMQPIGESVGDKLAEIWNARTTAVVNGMVGQEMAGNEVRCGEVRSAQESIGMAI